MTDTAAGTRILVARHYFCGRRFHDAGPYAFHLRGGRIAAITGPGEPGPGGIVAGAEGHEAVAFLMPGLVEAHCHLFLDGAVLDRAARGAGRRDEPDGMLAVAQTNVRLARAQGITLIRDAGDRHGINHRLRACSQAEPGLVIRSPGPAIFRQRRNGLDGEEIVVYKFRSMTTQDNGEVVHQATRDDPRVTPLGAFLRRTSLDELPQFVNVLQGRMSIVGPRPHAVAHNAQYRELIKAYMVRHKVRPGITGWAQVNGHRGETDTLEKMQARVEYDLEYLRNWSLLLDLQIVARTIKLVFFDRKAY